MAPTPRSTAYTPENHRRLRLVKAAYGPDNVFRVGHNIPPAAVASQRAA